MKVPPYHIFSRPRAALALTALLGLVSCTKGLEVNPVDPNAGRGSAESLSGEEQQNRRTMEILAQTGFPMGNLAAAEHPAFAALVRVVEALYPSAHAEGAPANPDRKVYVPISPSTWGDGHSVECMIKNVSPELTNPGVNPIDASAIVEVVVQAESGAYRNSFNNAFPPGNRTSYDRRLQPGETWNLVWSINVGPPAVPNGATNIGQQFPRGLTVVVRNSDPGKKGVVQGRCVHWWSNGGYNHDIPIFGGFPF